MNNKRVLAVIPARGGSKGLENKNILELHGKPLIIWTIEQAMNSKLIDKVVVTTDSQKISDVCKEYGYDVGPLRPPELASDESSIHDTISYIIEKEEQIYDAVALLEPTSPLRKIDDIDNCISILYDNWQSCDSVISLGQIQLEKPEYSKKINDGKITNYCQFDQKQISNRRQDIQKSYFPYGVCYICKTEPLLQFKTFYIDNAFPYFIERWQNYEIDDVFDFTCIQSIMTFMENQGVKI